MNSKSNLDWTGNGKWKLTFKQMKPVAFSLNWLKAFSKANLSLHVDVITMQVIGFASMVTWEEHKFASAPTL